MTAKHNNLICLRDITDGTGASEECQVWQELVRLQARIKVLEREAHLDELTGLFNRRHFNATMAQEVERTKRTGLPTSLILLDIDNFKNVNDDYGHGAGDLALQHIAKAMKESIRRLDVACRFGGDEYAVVLPGTSLTTATTVAKRLRQNIIDAPLVRSSGKPIPLTASFGVAATSNQFDSPKSFSLQSLSTAADRALYEAKKKGRNCVVADSGTNYSTTTI